MLFWRILYLGLFVIGIVLILFSTFSQNFAYFSLAFICLALSSIIWYTIRQLYTNFKMSKTPENQLFKTEVVTNAFDAIDVFTD